MLTVSTSVTFASAWFAWRLGAFQMANQPMAVRLLTSDALVDFAREEVDVGVRSGRGGWEGLCDHLLFQVDFTPMCSPDFLERNGGRISLERMLELPWISPDDVWWEIWLGEMGLKPPANAARTGVLIETQAHIGHAAMAGQGIAMLTPYFWRNDLAEGRLVRLFDHAGTRGYGYYLVYPEYRRQVPKIRRFRDWLLAEVERDKADGA
jgi:LysR family glycine cleavage system transcriptional activator